jgi:hypothetical protein
MLIKVFPSTHKRLKEIIKKLRNTEEKTSIEKLASDILNKGLEELEKKYHRTN